LTSPILCIYTDTEINMNLFLTILAGLVITATAAFTTTSHLFSNLASNKSENNINVQTPNLGISTDNVLGESTTGSVTPDPYESVSFNVDAVFNKALIIKSGKITADNIVYGIKPGAGISVGAGQTPVITNTGVTSLAGKTGELKLYTPLQPVCNSSDLTFS